MNKVLCIVTSPNDAARARRLASSLNAEISYCDVDKNSSRFESMRSVWKALTSQKWALVYLEGTGIAGGLTVIRAHYAWKQQFIVSAGDPIAGYFEVTASPLLGYIAEKYERLLYRTCSGYIGRTPYLTGMALKMGVRRAATIEGVDLELFHPYDRLAREEVRHRFGISPSELVLGVVGSLNWRHRSSYCYGLELVSSLEFVDRDDVTVLIVGDGTGLPVLKRLVPEKLRAKVIFTGRLPQREVVNCINAMDVAFVTQTLDSLGSYRLSTKLSEYLACGVPVAMSPVPGFFDFAAPVGWPLPPFSPSSRAFHTECAEWITQLRKKEIDERAIQARAVAAEYFDYDRACRKFSDFVGLVCDPSLAKQYSDSQ